MDLLRKLCEVRSPSGEEGSMKSFILEYVKSHCNDWKKSPRVVAGEGFQDCIILIFGKPKVAAFAHMDTTGFSVRYQDQLVPIGGPEVNGGEAVLGFDSLGEIICKLKLDEEGHLTYDFGRGIDSGTSLVFQNDFTRHDHHVTSAYLDNRVGIYNLLKIAEDLEDGALVFSCWEEHGGGTVPFLVKYLYEEEHINKMLISDVTWSTDGIHTGQGPVISIRDRSIPRKSFVRKVVQIAAHAKIPYQLEVEGYGSSDGREIQDSPYAIDWCFVGAAIENMHSQSEKIDCEDIRSLIDFYKLLFKKL